MAKHVIIFLCLGDQRLVVLDPGEAERRCDSGENKLHDEHEDDSSVSHRFELTELVLRLHRILEDFRVVASEDGDTMNKLSVTQAAASEHDVIDTERNLTTRRALDVTIVLVNDIVRHLTIDDTLEVLVKTLVLRQVLGSTARLKVCLTIQVLGLDVKRVLLLRTVDNADVARRELISHELDDVADAHVLPNLIFPCLFLTIIDLHFFIVLERVLLAFLVVFEQILHHGQEHNKHERYSHGRFTS